MRPEVKEFHFETFRPGPGLSDRLRALVKNKNDGKLLLDAERISSENGIPFWEALAGIAMVREGFHEDFIRAALFHVPNPATITFSLSATDLVNHGISKIVRQVAEGNALAICSKVRLGSGDSMHIPMMDFACPCSNPNANAVLKMLQIVGQHDGILAESGRSYHFYGASLLTHENWIDFMARNLLFAPFADPRYIAHRLADGQCRLRIHSERPTPVITRILM
jgi:hypothetical protein